MLRPNQRMKLAARVSWSCKTDFWQAHFRRYGSRHHAMMTGVGGVLPNKRMTLRARVD